MESKEHFKTAVEIVSRRTGKTQAQLAAALGYGENYISEVLSPTGKITGKFLRAFRLQYAEFLENPNSNNIVEDNGGATYLEKRRIAKHEGKKRIPFFDAEASGGLVETEMTPISAPAGTIDIGDLLHDSQAAIRIYGNSMLPNYPPGCVVGLSRCNSTFIEPGEVYVIETRDRRLLKRLFYPNDKSDSNAVLCYSDNVMKFEGGAREGKLAYPPFEIPKNEIINLFVVTGVIKRNANSIIINR